MTEHSKIYPWPAVMNRKTASKFLDRSVNSAALFFERNNVPIVRAPDGKGIKYYAQTDLLIAIEREKTRCN